MLMHTSPSNDETRDLFGLTTGEAARLAGMRSGEALLLNSEGTRKWITTRGVASPEELTLLTTPALGADA
jgi:hypothetical protein